ncbi:MAG: peptide ABC transporter permease [Chlamydiae bacterium CG10_big_fil_rev_8_21_14_0_10_35_9]|nr:MAG: peptide ABC transporter permease [Chlamydiae bacterium CG10_big_fil_rev_8_21_14_0_10_35_9]
MLSYIIKKSITLLFSLFFVITVTFVLMQAMPGDPFSHLDNIPAEVVQALHAHYGLDKPLFQQYVTYLYKILQFDFGFSLVYQGRSINQIILEGFPTTFLLGMQSLLLSLSLGGLTGAAFSLRKKNNSFFLVFTSLWFSMPMLVIASLLQYLFAMKLHLLPVARFDSFFHTILPTITLSLFPSAFIAKLFKASLDEVTKTEHVRFAKAKGLSAKQIFFKHLLKNACLPVIAYLGPLTIYLLTGSFIVEKIFAIPGLGMWMVLSIIARDYSVIMGLTVFFSMILLTINFLVDIAYLFLDPKIQNYVIKQPI